MSRVRGRRGRLSWVDGPTSASGTANGRGVEADVAAVAVAEVDAAEVLEPLHAQQTVENAGSDERPAESPHAWPAWQIAKPKELRRSWLRRVRGLLL